MANLVRREAISAADAEMQWRMCQRSLPFFVSRFTNITYRGKLIPLVPFPYQWELMDMHLNHMIVMVLKARQIGFSTIVASIMLWHSIMHDYTVSFNTSFLKDQARKIIRHARLDVFEQLPWWMRDRAPNLTRKTLYELEWDNGSSMHAAAVTSEPARGETVNGLFFADELAYYKDPEAVWQAALPAIEHGGRLIAGGSAKVAEDMFHNLFRDAGEGIVDEDGQHQDIVRMFAGWDSRPDRDAAWYEREKRKWKNRDPVRFVREHPASPEEAFAYSSAVLFDPQSLLAQMLTQPVRGRLKPGGVFEEHLGGELAVWVLPEKTRTYVIGADIARGRLAGDFSCAQVICVDDGQQVAVWHGRCDTDVFGVILEQLGYWYNTALIAPEANPPGDATGRVLRDRKYPTLYRMTTKGKRRDTITEHIGWYTSNSTKPGAVAECNGAIRDRVIHLHDIETVKELGSFVLTDSGKMEGTPHDDRVMGLVIAEQMRRESLMLGRGPTPVKAPAPEWSKEWMLEAARLQREARGLGRPSPGQLRGYG